MTALPENDPGELEIEEVQRTGEHFEVSAILLVLITLIAGLTLWLFFYPDPARAECRPEPVTPNTPTGIAGCEVWGDGTASHYGPGNGVAMNWCTWEAHQGHTQPCGWVTIQSHQTGIVVTVPVVDFCDCYTGTADQRVVDLQYGVVDALGLDRSQGLYPVTVWREGVYPVAGPAGSADGDAAPSPTPPGETASGVSDSPAGPMLPDTAMQP